MKDKGWLWIVVAGAVFILLFLFFLYAPFSIVGHVLTGTVSLTVTDTSKVITIDSPENTTYSFGIGDDYLVNLNVSASYTTDAWKYDLYDLQHEEYVEQDTAFAPNTTITAVRWGNLLTVYGREDGGGWYDEDVVFTVDVPNSAPVIESLDAEYFACEGDSGTIFYFNGSDIDEEYFSARASPSYSNFYASSYLSFNETLKKFKVFSLTLDKNDVGSYPLTVELTDGESYSTCGARCDTTVISVIETNEAPVAENLGAQTIYLQGDNSTFNRTWQVSDVETAAGYGELLYNSSIVGGDIFEINLTTGLMEYVPISTDDGKTYSVTICVNDSGIETTSEDFDFCADQGYSNESISVCDDFTLTVTSDNRAPQIVSYSTTDSQINVSGTESSTFTATVYDADGTIPDIDWYVNGELQEHNEGVLSDSFVYSFGCGVEGLYYVNVSTTDGLETSSVSWLANVSLVSCPSSSGTSGGGGGGGGGGGPLSISCVENWVCGDFGVCQNVKRSYSSGGLSIEDYTDLKEVCAQKGYDERYCGFQVTSCLDLNNCTNPGSNIARPAEMQTCYFTEDPSCSDGITNCHDGSCEVLVDCGGPCPSCATCSDGVRNQGEDGVDCGGPCPWNCETESPFGVSLGVLIVLVSSALLLAILIFIRAARIIHYRVSRKR